MICFIFSICLAQKACGIFGRTCQCPTHVTEKIGGLQARQRLDGCSGCAKCSSEGEWGEITVTKKVIQAAPYRKRDCALI